MLGVVRVLLCHATRYLAFVACQTRTPCLGIERINEIHRGYFVTYFTIFIHTSAGPSGFEPLLSRLH